MKLVRLKWKSLDYSGLSVLQKPLVAKHRAFVNIAYVTNSKWKVDYTTQWFSRKRLPNTDGNPVDRKVLDL